MTFNRLRHETKSSGWSEMKSRKAQYFSTLQRWPDGDEKPFIGRRNVQKSKSRVLDLETFVE
jgi:hypothetical protein